MGPRFLAACVLATALLAPLGARAVGVDPDAATPVQREQAQARFGRGRDLYAAKKFREALAEFQGSHDIVSSPNARLYVAHCHRELGELVLAYEEFGRAATEAKEHAVGDPRYVKTAEAAQRERDAIAPKLGFVTLTVANVTPESKLKIAGEEIQRAAWSEAAPVLPGTTEIVLETPDRPPARVSVTVAPGERKEVTIDAGPAPAPKAEETAPAPPPPVEESHPSSGLRTAAYVAGGVGVVGFAAFTIFGLKAKSTFNGLQSECPNGHCATDRSSEVSSGKSQQTLANVGLAVGAVGVVAGVTLFLISGHGGKTDAPSAALVVGPSWVGARGAF
jgi:hypothetical protein